MWHSAKAVFNLVVVRLDYAARLKDAKIIIIIILVFL